MTDILKEVYYSGVLWGGPLCERRPTGTLCSAFWKLFSAVSPP